MLHISSDNSKSILTNVQDGDIQPNATDLRIDKIFKIENNIFEIDKDNNKKHRSITKIEADRNGFYFLNEGHYAVIMENDIEVGENECGFVITRSTFNRNGCYLTSGLYDSGYKGHMAACLHVTSGALKIQKGTRIGQYLCFHCNSLYKYNGSYGVNSEYDKKYE